jgi:hypothetical protein
VACSPCGARGDFFDPDFSNQTTSDTLVEKSDFSPGFINDNYVKLSHGKILIGHFDLA